MLRSWNWGGTFALVVGVLGGGVVAACGDDGGTSASVGPTSGTGTGAGTGSASGGGGAGGSTGAAFTTGAGGANTAGFDVQPEAMQTITVALGAQSPAVVFAATNNGAPVNAGWSVDKGNVGTIAAGPAPEATFLPTGTTGGLVKVLAGFGGQTLERTILVRLEGAQNGYDPQNPLDVAQVPTSVAELTQGGGIGGVGGEGLGPAVSDAGLLAALEAPIGKGQAEALKFLYPYDKTVWPRGLLAPNLMWRWSKGDADAVRIELSTTTGSFHWVGTFARPAILSQTGKPFVRHPIPQSVWQAATNTAGGADRLTVKITVAKDGQAYGPIEQTYTLAPARLSGTIYYGSYGTKLAQNYPGAIGGNGMFGGAVLSIKVGDPGPQLTAGGNGPTTECRVCHSVAANGSRLVTQRSGYGNSTYELSPMGVGPEMQLTDLSEFPAVSPDGAHLVATNGQLRALPADATPLPASGLTAVSTALGTPAFAPDGKKLAFAMLTSGVIQNPKQKLVVMDFDPMTLTFSNPITVVDETGQPAETRPGWPAFFPTGESVVYHRQLASGVDGNNLADLRTRKGARAQIHWTKTSDASATTRLDRLNGLEAGVSYLPTLPSPIALGCTGDGAPVGNIDADHGNDTTLNYEPTLAPVASGGYAWVVFTSRRLYGNVAEIPPFCSDPRGVDLFQNITTKKLWVAAIDINGQPGEDASHPAFYLPGQELLAGNARGFWVLDPCKMDGEGCSAGDECCNGYCQPDDSGALVCLNAPPMGDCSAPQEVCTTAADCCDATNLCINGFCSVTPPQ